MSITITQTINTDAKWAGTTPGSANASIVAYRLYVAAIDGGPGQYRFVDQKDNPGASTITWGTYTLAQLGVPVIRPFYLKVIPVTNKAIADKDAANLVAQATALKVTPSGLPGWTIGQLLEQGVRPILLVGFDPSTGNCYPLNVVADSANGGFKLKTDNT